jgi:AraC-like DNA-binding protein
MSPYHFIRLFKAVFGDTPKQCQLHARLERAKHLLLTTDSSVTDVRAEYERLKCLGVMFTAAPTEAGPVTIAVFSDTCGNLIQLYQANRTG